MHHGKLIVIEGTDGSGKHTQAEALLEKLQQAGHDIAFWSFPQYGKPSAKKVEDYLAGRNGRTTEVNPYIASRFFAEDQLEAAPTIRELVEQGCIVVLDRYVDSNAGHQGAKLPTHEKWEEFMLWLYDYEYNQLKLPKPDLVLVLHVTADKGKELADKERSKGALGKIKVAGDGHESDVEHLRSAEKSYLWLAERFPENHTVIECMKDGALLPPDVICNLIWDAVYPMLPST